MGVRVRLVLIPFYSVNRIAAIICGVRALWARDRVAAEDAVVHRTIVEVNNLVKPLYVAGMLSELMR
jgi:hypothetical protein